MKYCPSCNEQYPNSSMFCGNDGTRLETTRIPVTEEISLPDAPSGTQKLREGIKPIYIIGGAIAAGLILLVALVPSFTRLFIPSGTPNAPPSSPADALGPSAPMGPTSAEVSAPAPIPETTAPPSASESAKAIEPAKQGQDFPVPQTPGTVITKATRQPSDFEKSSSVTSTAQRSEVFVKRPGLPSTPEGTKTIDVPLPKNPTVTREGLGDRAEKMPPVKETQIPRRPAEPGAYETMKRTVARTAPSDSADIVDQINSGIRLNVTGSQGDWLVVYSKTRNRTVYVKRDDAMLIAERSTPSQSSTYSEQKQKEIENQIQQAIARRGITGVSVSFIGDTVFLKGTVQSEDERFAAELAARSFPEVTHIHNGIWVNR